MEANHLENLNGPENNNYSLYMLYIGSCRYMYGYKWDYFPARLHSTREIIYFLENITTIKKCIPNELTNCIFGDIGHPSVVKDANRFANQPIHKNIHKIIIEISSRKVMYHHTIPLNSFYSHKYKLIQKYNLVQKRLTDKEVEYDLNYIIKLCRTIFNEHIQIHIIPHLNLKTKSTLDYIPERNNFVNLLERLCSKYNIKIHNIGKYIESNKPSFLEDYMADSTHYSKDYDKVKLFLLKEIYV